MDFKKENNEIKSEEEFLEKNFSFKKDLLEEEKKRDSNLVSNFAFDFGISAEDLSRAKEEILLEEKKEHRVHLGHDFSLDVTELENFDWDVTDIIENKDLTENLVEKESKSSKKVLGEKARAAAPSPSTQNSQKMSLSQSQSVFQESRWIVPPQKSVLQPSFSIEKPQTIGIQQEIFRQDKTLLKPTGFSLLVFTFDLLAYAFAVSLLSIFLLWFTEFSFIHFLTSIQQRPTSQFTMVFMLVAFFHTYVILARGAFGCTLGEWTFDCQLGTDEQVNSATYVLKVFWRSVVVLVTGIIFLPLLSLIFNKDLAGTLSRLLLYRRS